MFLTEFNSWDLYGILPVRGIKRAQVCRVVVQGLSLSQGLWKQSSRHALRNVYSSSSPHLGFCPWRQLQSCTYIHAALYFRHCCKCYKCIFLLNVDKERSSGTINLTERNLFVYITTQTISEISKNKHVMCVIIFCTRTCCFAYLSFAYSHWM